MHNRRRNADFRIPPLSDGWDVQVYYEGRYSYEGWHWVGTPHDQRETTRRSRSRRGFRSEAEAILSAARAGAKCVERRLHGGDGLSLERDSVGAARVVAVGIGLTTASQ